MTIRVAKDGYYGTAVPGHGLLLIDGVLHRSVVPTNSSREVWIPVRTYDGPVEHVDRQGTPWPPYRPAGAARGWGRARGRGRMMDNLSEPLTREDVDLMALEFLWRNDGDAVGVIDDENKMAAALIYIDLEKRGLAAAVRRETGPFYTITTAGRAKLLETAP